MEMRQKLQGDLISLKKETLVGVSSWLLTTPAGHRGAPVGFWLVRLILGLQLTVIFIIN